jgi:lipoyl(octanoyl) transferase
MNIEIKKSIKPVKYNDAINLLETRLKEVHENKNKELIWILEHQSVYTAGTGFSKNEILDSSINLLKTNRGGKITFHNPGQLIFYFVLDLKKRKKDIRKFITILENTIIETLKLYDINCFADKKNVGIWFKDKSGIKKIAAIGVRVSKWIAYHGFSINIDNDLLPYKKIIPCGISDKGITKLKNISNQKYDDIDKLLVKKFILNLKNLNV